MAKRSAGLLMYRRNDGVLEVLLVHPGGPFWPRRNEGAWSFPKGEYDSGVETALDAAKREFTEETGFTPGTRHASLGEAGQRSGKLVSAWAFEGDCDPQALESNTFELEWPPRSGNFKNFAEADRAAWFTMAAARKSILSGLVVFIDRLEALSA
ncbi:NUDIX domain-containing protein [Variovorax sp. LjRoot130]|uniref:NUDIX domain-containing protein n=1 Tax=Variovorax sp. LjRoot130 TaxID=3342261 RepID=UPI003ECF0A04